MKQVRFGPYEVLANAIIITAAEDFRNGIKILRRHLGKRPQDVKSDKYKDWFEDKKKYYRDLRDIKRFFHSRWFGVLSQADGKVIYESLRSEVRR